MPMWVLVIYDTLNMTKCHNYSYRRLDKGFFATFFVRHYAH